MKRLLIASIAALGIAAVVVVVWLQPLLAQQASRPLPPHAGPMQQAGALGMTLATPAQDITITLDQATRSGTTYDFHAVIHNAGAHPLAIAASGVGAFVLNGAPVASGAAPIVLSAAAGDAAHPALAGVIPSGATRSGWLSATAPSTTYTAVQVFYQYQAVTTTRCANPSMPTTCALATLYEDMVWDLR